MGDANRLISSGHFKNLNKNICNKLESIDRGYIGDNLDPIDWAELSRNNDDSWNNPILYTLMYEVDYLMAYCHLCRSRYCGEFNYSK